MTVFLMACRLDLKSTVHLWQSLLQETRHIAKEHSSQADVYSTEMVARFDIISKDVILLAKRVSLYVLYG